MDLVARGVEFVAVSACVPSGGGVVTSRAPVAQGRMAREGHSAVCWREHEGCALEAARLLASSKREFWASQTYRFDQAASSQRRGRLAGAELREQVVAARSMLETNREAGAARAGRPRGGVWS